MKIAEKLRASYWFVPARDFKAACSALVWGCSPARLNAASKLSRLKDRYKGQKCVILCNGPSLNSVDLTCFEGCKTIGLNKINLLFDRTEFRPDFIVAVNPYVLEQNMEFYRSTSIELFLDERASRFGLGRKGNQVLLKTGGHGFSTDLMKTVPQGHTVTYVAMQVLYFLGFSKVALVGCDHNFETKGPANKAVTAGDSDPNHFDPRYFSKGVTWQLPDLFESEIAYLRARNVFEQDGRALVNCTEGGKLEIFDRMSLAEFLRW